MVEELLTTIKEKYVTILKDNLVGIYLHGSLAFGCFQWDSSDIDFIVVIKHSLFQKQKEELIQTLLDLDANAPQKGFEMSVILEKYCQNFIYPTPYELHYSNAHKANYLQNLSDYCRKMQGVDIDLAAHFTVINHVGKVLCGKSINEVFETVPRPYYIDSICKDIQDANATNPIYYVLNICRVLAYLKEEKVLSKKDGALWAIKHINEEDRDVVRNALEAYMHQVPFKDDITLWVNYYLKVIEDEMDEKSYSI